MTDAPERPWIYFFDNPEGEASWSLKELPGCGMTEYIRADVTEARIAELEAALASCEAWIVDGGHVDDDDVRNGETGARLVYEQARAALRGRKKND